MRGLGAIAVTAVLLLSGCAVGRFIAGAPSARSTTPARALLARRCAGCHAVPDPAGMSAAAWDAALERMRRRLRLPEAEWDSLGAMRTAR